MLPSREWLEPTGANASAAMATDYSDREDDDDDDDLQELVVDQELVRGLVASGAADAIAASELAERRRKHSESMMRYRHRRQGKFDDMKRQERALTAQLQSMLSAEVSVVHELLCVTSDDEQEEVAQSPAPVVTQQLVQVLAEKEQLHSESQTLRQQLGEVHQFHHVMRTELERQKKEQQQHQNEVSTKSKCKKSTKKKKHAPSNSRDAGYWVTFLEDEPPFYFVPFTELECRGIAHDTNESVLRLQMIPFLSNTGDSTVRVVQFFQWCAHLSLEWDKLLQRTMLRFKFFKRFRHPMRTVSELVMRMWEVLHTPALYQNLYCVPVNSRVLQSWNDDVSVALWNTPDPDQTLKYRTASIYAHGPLVNVQGDDCNLVTITGVKLKTQRGPSSIDREDVGCPQSPSDTNAEEVVFTSEGVIYTMFANGTSSTTTTTKGADEEEGAISVEFGGRVEVVNEIQARFLMVELGGSLVRLEHLLLPFRVLSTE